jgi:K+-transporting ATPase ATPase C chain
MTSPANDRPAPGFAASVIAQLFPACAVLAVLTVVTGIVYPVAMTVAIQAAFPGPASGNQVQDAAGVARGSRLIGQQFGGPRWFHGRPSGTGNGPYDPTASGGTNLGPTNPALATAVRERAEALTRDNPAHSAAIPIDLVTASGSGLDPHVSPAAALLQVPRVAAARNLDEQAVRRLVEQHVEPALLGVFGRPRVNVLELNLALERLSRGPEQSSAN